MRSTLHAPIDPATRGLNGYTWFEHLAPEDEVCTNGMKLHKILRFQFNANQDLVKTTKKEYCGTPPVSAWR